jgi:putative transposase
MNLLPQRRSPRLKGYDYTQEGAYFVTICTRHRVHLFGEVVDGEMILNEVGAIAAACWEEISAHFPNVEIDAAVVMPNHVHGIVVIVEKEEEKKPNGHDASCPYSDGETFGQPRRGSLSNIIRLYKAAVTRKIGRSFPEVEMPIWQGRFHDHIIRNQRSLDVIREYVVNNPARWVEDTFYGG